MFSYFYPILSTNSRVHQLLLTIIQPLSTILHVNLTGKAANTNIEELNLSVCKSQTDHWTNSNTTIQKRKVQQTSNLYIMIFPIQKHGSIIVYGSINIYYHPILNKHCHRLIGNISQLPFNNKLSFPISWDNTQITTNQNII